MRAKKGVKLGFTVMELMIVMIIIGVLASVTVSALGGAIQKAHFVRTLHEMRAMVGAIHIFMLNNDFNYPADVSRDLPPGIEQYLSSAPDWPSAPWPGSVYDYDYWDSDPSNPHAGTLSHPPNGEVVQISVRFCPLGNPAGCRFPNESWAEDFDYHSSAYWCMAGSCRAHGSMPYNHPGCCLGGACPVDQSRCE